MILHQTGLHPMSLFAQFRAIFGWAIWRFPLAARQLGLQLYRLQGIHPDGPSIMTWNQLEDVHKAFVTAHRERDVSGMLKGVVSNMHPLAKFAREAGFLPYIGQAHYIYECYLKSQINSSRPPSGYDISSVWSLQTDLDRDMPKVCSLATKPSL